MTKLKEDYKTELSMQQRISIMESLFEKLASLLNSVHNRNYSVRFWKILLESHVKAVISRREILSRRKIEKKPHMFAINSSSIPDRRKILSKQFIDFLKHLKTRKNLKRANEVLNQNNKVRIGFFEYPELNDENIGVLLPTYHPFMAGRGEKEKRISVNKISDAQDDIFFANVIRELPKVLVEHFGKLTDSVNLAHPSEKELHVHTTQSFFNQVLIATYVENGARLIWYQHGSYYGEFAGDSEHHYEHDVSDEYRTWGWKIKEKDIPWKAYRLEKFKREYNSYSNQKKHDLLVSFSRINNQNRQKSKETTNYLLNNLSPELYKTFLARPQPANKVFSQKFQLDFIENPRIIKSNGLSHMAEDMSKCRLVLQMRVPATNFLECAYVNHPTVGLLRNDQPTDIIKPFYEFFLEEGVLHHSLDSLVEHLNHVDVEKWWGSITSKREWREFRQLYTSPV